MRYTNERIDHLVYAVPDLEKAIVDIEKKFGVKPEMGGHHKSQGTYNALLNLGEGRYLELLAVDKKNKNARSPRWMGVDLIDGPTLTRWAVSTNKLEKDVAYLTTVDPRLGSIKNGNRKRMDGTMLAWKMSMPLPDPKVEVLPFVIDWKGNEHPTNTLPEGCRLISLRATHPTPFIIEPAIHSLDVDIQIDVSEQVSLTAEIETPNGVFEI